MSTRPASEDDERLERFIGQLAARGGVGRCYWHRALWPAENAGLVRSKYEPVETPRHRTRPIRQWCYQVTLTEAGWSMADRLASDREDAPDEDRNCAEPVEVDRGHPVAVDRGQ